MTVEELLRLHQCGESDRIEWKRSAADMEKMRRTICAFSNDLPGHGEPGVLFVGRRDDGGCEGLEVSDELLTRLAQLRSEGLIVPLPAMEVERHLLDGCELAVIVVHPVSAPPVRYKGQIWVRNGPTTVLAGEMDEQRLRDRRRAADLPFDWRPVRGCSLADLDLDWFRSTYLPSAVAGDVLERNHRSIEEQLASLRFVVSAAEPIPTAMGILAAGRDPRMWLPGAYVQFVRFAGGSMDAPIVDQSEIGGPLPLLLSRLEDKVAAHIRVASQVTGSPVEVRRPDYPLDALRQIVRNAVMHRTYEGTNAPVRVMWFADRIEIWSPGGPYGIVNRVNFGQPGVTDYRNPGLAEAMKSLGYVQKFGMGIQLARALTRNNGNGELVLQPEDHAVLVTIRSAA